MSPSLFGNSEDEDEETQLSEMLNAPMERGDVEAARANNVFEAERLESGAVDLIERVQGFVDEHDYEGEPDTEYKRLFDEVSGTVDSVGVAKKGNAFVDWLAHQFQQQNLIEPRKVTADTIIFIATEEVWAYVATELRLEGSEAKAVRNIHNFYAAQNGLTSSLGHSIMAINAEHDQIQEIISLVDIDTLDTEEFHASKYEAERRQQS